MPSSRSLVLVGALALALSTPSTVAAQTDSLPVYEPPKPRPLMAIGQVLAINLIVNRIDAYVLDEWWAKNAGIHSWESNFTLGWEWDEDNFTTNMFAHPYHGAMYFNAGRANGLSFWESAPIAFFGSWNWEYFGEAKRPSLNDFFMTSFGGIALGEMFHRVGTSIRDNEARGVTRKLKELAALPFDPIGGLNRLFRGEWHERSANPPEHDPGSYVLRVQGGLRLMKNVEVDSAARLGVMVVDLFYGDQFRTKYARPFDVFGVRAVISSGGGFNAMRASGRLFATDITDPTNPWRNIFSINQRFDYVANPAYSVGGQSIEFGLLSRWNLNNGFGLRTQIFGDVILLGAVDAAGAGLGLRNYDFGPGGGARGDVTFERRGVRYLTVYGQGEVLGSVSGASATHVIGFGGIELTIPIARRLGVALHATHFTRISNYSDRAQARRDYDEVRLLVAWTKAGFK